MTNIIQYETINEDKRDKKEKVFSLLKFSFREGFRSLQITPTVDE